MSEDVQDMGVEPFLAFPSTPTQYVWALDAILQHPAGA